MTELHTLFWVKKHKDAPTGFDGGGWVPHYLPDYEEYQRRNLLHAGSIGAASCVQAIRERVMSWSEPPKWLLEKLDEIEKRVMPTTPDLALWRDQVGYVKTPHNHPKIQAALASAAEPPEAAQ